MISNESPASIHTRLRSQHTSMRLQSKGYYTENEEGSFFEDRPDERLGNLPDERQPAHRKKLEHMISTINQRRKERKRQKAFFGRRGKDNFAGGFFDHDNQKSERPEGFLEAIFSKMTLLFGLDDDADDNRPWYDPKQFARPPPDTPENIPVDKLRKMRLKQVEEWESAGIFYNYSQRAIPTNETLPDPMLSYPNDTLAVVVLSSRSNVALRQAIRESWGGDHTVIFVIGGKPKNESVSLQLDLAEEANKYHDILDSIHPESYMSLPYKLHFAYKWIMRNMPNVQWVIKADDDTVVRVATLRRALLDVYNPNLPILMGKINPHSKVKRKGKWKEFWYEEQFYPRKWTDRSNARVTMTTVQC